MKISQSERHSGPPIKTIRDIPFPAFESWHLSNGLKVYGINAGTQEVIKCEFVFLSGRTFENKKLVSRACAALLRDGTQSFTSAEIAKKTDFFGVTINSSGGMDTASVTLYCLKKHLSSILPIVVDIIQNPIFPQNEIDRFRDRSFHRLEIELRKNDVVAYRKLTESIFGSDHPYGYNSTKELYNYVTQDDLIDFHASHFHMGNALLFVSGKVDDEVKRIIEDIVSILPSKEKTTRPQHIITPASNKKNRYKTTQTLQSAIRLGKHMFDRNHSDFYGFSFLSTILGGYFGSRLMKNIREEKGYTYNIDCSLDTMLYDGYFQIGTEVANENIDATLVEIYKEMELLKTVPISNIELNMLKNYILGNMLNLLDGPFNIAKLIKMFVLTGNDIAHFQKGIDSIHTMTPDRLQNLAIQYFDVETFHEVIVGA